MTTITARFYTVKQAESSELSPEKIASIRKEVLDVSQNIFAKLLNVSPQAVHAWEQGLKQPSGMAIRLLKIAENTPEIFLGLVEEGDRKS
jgi:DNA-binding transcriptional regulator YiaG